jgi:hypothetical protein
VVVVNGVVVDWWLGLAISAWWWLGLADLDGSGLGFGLVVDWPAWWLIGGLGLLISAWWWLIRWLGLPISAWWWLIRWLGLRWVWLFADLDVVVWACAAEIGLVWWLGLRLGFRCTAWWWLTAWAWAWVHRVVVGFSGFCRLGFGARRGGWAWVHGVVVVDGVVVGNRFGFLVVEPWVSAWRWWSRAGSGFFFSFLIL